MSGQMNRLNQWLQDSVFKPLEDKKMPVMEHLVELQARLTRAVVATGVLFVLTFFYAETLVAWIRIPLQNMFVPSRLEWVPTDLETIPFVFLAPAEALWQNVKVAGLFAIVLAAPYILWELWQFTVPGLHSQERRFVGPFVLLSSLAFYAGIAFSFFFVLPFALNFLITYGVNAGFIPKISIAQYVGFALWFLLVFGIIFEVPLAITLMAKLGWVDAPFLKQYRKWAFLAAFIFAALLTPTPDPFNQCLMALPMYIFYEVGIISAGVFNKKKRQADAEEAAANSGLVPTPAGGSAHPEGKTAKSGGKAGDEYLAVPTGAGPR
ncbi:Sec-independent protein translocase protein TatC [Nitrospira sp.]|nr:Sec-independent protein translocase protein TatC [Nitrospira sp.]